MKFFRHLICLSAALLLCLCPRTQAEAVLTAPAAIVSYDRTELDDWTPGYGLSMPGVLLELTHAEGMLSVSALETDGLSPKVDRHPSPHLPAQLHSLQQQVRP